MKLRQLQRREFITLLGGAAGWPLAAQAQQGSRMRRIGVLMPFAESDPDAMAQLSGFIQGLAQLGWTDGRKCASCGQSLAEVEEKTASHR
jgi:putative ABC transport system substrate-binding protein